MIVERLIGYQLKVISREEASVRKALALLSKASPSSFLGRKWGPVQVLDEELGAWVYVGRLDFTDAKHLMPKALVIGKPQGELEALDE